jgi:class 3 adenylate cyclase
VSAIDRLTVMFVAVDGMEALAARSGQAAAHAHTRRLVEHLRGIAVEFDGEPVDEVGAELLILFPTSDAALNAACRMMKDVHEDPAVADPALSGRVGLHHGVVYRKDTDVFGDSINTAARVKAEAAPGHLLLTDRVQLTLHAESLAIVTPYDRIEVKGKAKPLVLHQAAWAPEDLNRTTVMASMIDAGYLKDLAAETLHLDVDGAVRTITPADAPVTVGRGETCMLTLDAPTASRLHARIEHRRGKFLLVDSSVNGTTLVRADGSTMHLKREEAVLTGRGRFAPGEAATPGAPGTVGFECY